MDDRLIGTDEFAVIDDNSPKYKNFDTFVRQKFGSWLNLALECKYSKISSDQVDIGFSIIEKEPNPSLAPHARRSPYLRRVAVSVHMETIKLKAFDELLQKDLQCPSCKSGEVHLLKFKKRMLGCFSCQFTWRIR